MRQRLSHVFYVALGKPGLRQSLENIRLPGTGLYRVRRQQVGFEIPGIDPCPHRLEIGCSPRIKLSLEGTSPVTGNAAKFADESEPTGALIEPIPVQAGKDGGNRIGSPKASSRKQQGERKNTGRGKFIQRIGSWILLYLQASHFIQTSP